MSADQPISGHKGRDHWLRAILTRDVLKLLEVRVAVLLSIHFNCTNGRCDPGYKKLMSELRISRRTLFRGLARLKADGWIEVRRLGEENAQFSLFIPAGANMVIPAGGANMVTPPKVPVEVPENEGAGVKNVGVEVPHRLAAHKNPITREPVRDAEGVVSHASPGVSYSATDSTADDAAHNRAFGTVDDAPIPATDGPVPRADARTEPVEQSSRVKSEKEMGRAATNGGAASVPTPFAQVLSVYPEDRVGDEAKAYFAFKRALDARGTLSAVLATSPA